MRIGYYANKNIEFIKYYLDGELNGHTLWFYPNGNLEQVVMYKYGAPNGNSYSFYESGTIKSVRFWNDGKITGYGNDFYDTTLWVLKSVLYFDKKGHMIYKKDYKKVGEVEDEVKPSK